VRVHSVYITNNSITFIYLTHLTALNKKQQELNTVHSKNVHDVQYQAIMSLCAIHCNYIHIKTVP